MPKKKHCAVVTGATRGIGYAVAKRLLEDGLKVIVTGTKTEAEYPKGATYFPVDFLNEKLVITFIKYLKNQKIDILVNNAGINKIDKFVDINIDDFDHILNVNLRTPLLLCQAVIPYMKQKKWGRIVNITSIWSHISKEFRASYSSSKFGLDGMTAALSAEVSEYGILANSVAPGFINTELTRHILTTQEISKIKKQIPMQRLGHVEEVAKLVSWLVSEENTYISGQNMIIDGGFSRV